MIRATKDGLAYVREMRNQTVFWCRTARYAAGAAMAVFGAAAVIAFAYDAFSPSEFSMTGDQDLLGIVVGIAYIVVGMSVIYWGQLRRKGGRIIASRSRRGGSSRVSRSPLGTAGH